MKQRVPRMPLLATMARSPSSTADRASDVIAREVRREMARRSFLFFITYYLRTEQGEPFDMRPFHVEMAETAQDERATPLLMLLEPASFGKSTLIAKAYPIWRACVIDPNVRIALGGKTFDDAVRRLRTIKSELEGNERLIEDFGPFKGDVWKEDQITLSGRTSIANEATITCFGSETNVFGWRADAVILDDIVTNQNSGSQVKDGTRERLRDNFHQGVMKMGTVGRPFAVRWANTVVDLRDLTHEVGRLNDHRDSAEKTWTTPDGWKVIRRQAIDESSGEALWPQVYGPAEAERDKSRDILMFLKRMQNQCLEPELMPFKQEWFAGNGADLPGCLDHERILGAQKPGSLSAQGFDPAVSLGERADWCGQLVVEFDKDEPEPRTYRAIWIDQFRGSVDDQAERVVRAHGRFGSAKTKIEANAAQQWLLQVKTIRDATTAQGGTVHGAMRIEPHFTTAANKPDPDIGLPSLAPMVKAGKLRLPYGDARSREMSDKLVGQMLLYPMGHSGDLLMALWFAVLAAREVARVNTLRKVTRALPDWAAGFGMVRPQGPRTVLR